MISKRKIWNRAESNKCYLLSYNIMSSSVFTIFIAFCIGLNILILAMDQYPSIEAYDQLNQYTNIIFYTIFLLEMIVKLLGQGI